MCQKGCCPLWNPLPRTLKVSLDSSFTSPDKRNQAVLYFPFILCISRQSFHEHFFLSVHSSEALLSFFNFSNRPSLILLFKTPLHCVSHIRHEHFLRNQGNSIFVAENDHALSSRQSKQISCPLRDDDLTSADIKERNPFRINRQISFHSAVSIN